MQIESLEDRRFLSASPVAAMAKAGGVASLAQSAPQAVSAVANPGGVTKGAPAVSQANTVAAAAKAGTIADTAKSAAGAVAAIAHP